MGQPTRVFLCLIHDKVQVKIESLLPFLLHARFLLEVHHLLDVGPEQLDVLGDSGGDFAQTVRLLLNRSFLARCLILEK